MLIIHMWLLGSKTQKARLRMLSGELNVILPMTDAATNHLYVVAPVAKVSTDTIVQRFGPTLGRPRSRREVWFRPKSGRV